MNKISPVSPEGSVNRPVPLKKQAGYVSFEDRLKSAVKDVNARQNTADDATEQVLKGTLGIQEGMMAIQEADVSLRYMVQVRGKVLDAYQEIMRMQV